MNLVIDFGNTLLKIAYYDTAVLKDRFVYDKTEIPMLTQQLQNHKFDTCILSSVIDIDVFFIDFLRSISKEFILFSHEFPLPIKLSYQTPTTLGNDRLALAAGAYFRFPSQNALVISAGSCITYDFVDEKAVYHGGAISPGIQMRFKALNHFTDKLPLVEQDQYDMKLTGNTTAESIIIGVQMGLAFEIKSFIDAYQKRFKDLMIILCGGDTNYFVKKLKNITFADEYFSLFSLNQIVLFHDK